MYVSGSIVDFESRLHQFTTGQNDLDNFMIEASGYSGQATIQEREKWNNELAKQSYVDLGDNQYYLNPPLSFPTL